MERLSSSHQAHIIQLQTQFQSEIHVKEAAANAALQAKRKAEQDLVRERTMWQTALASMNESQAREESLKARVMAQRSEINALKSRRGGLGA
ncbi:hypothetical protein DUNSADRAFT_8065 [Dunaliella salina]|uniref:Uncharacterized protein n=1 Tax=Dunaliella salina TaxID=3046 RepID=A0ABQ7GKA3_DUNSA|nr:hypothetical protein DUNSADRAFT_8065 [Dunaliella salina]|eukprot:KAF5835008.1 hypothetical protein DUNSADRAFT_8065 [Dunaliella salina]